MKEVTETYLGCAEGIKANFRNEYYPSPILSSSSKTSFGFFADQLNSLSMCKACTTFTGPLTSARYNWCFLTGRSSIGFVM